MPERDLLDALARVLDDGYDLQPPPNRVAAVRANVERRRAAANGNGAARPDPAAVPAPVPVPETIAEPVPRPTPIESRRPRRPGRYVLVAAATAAVFVVGILLGHGMPGPVRQVAHAVAPAWVESPDLHAARARSTTWAGPCPPAMSPGRARPTPRC